MPRLSPDSFRFRIFVAILAVALVPAAVAVLGGTLTLRSVGTSSGTLGAWDSVAESGRALLQSLEEAEVTDSTVAAAAAAHRRALSESVRLSRLYAFIAGRFVQVLPLAGLLATLLVVGLALTVATLVARTLGAPISELAEWTGRIGRGEPLPEPGPEETRGVEEIRTLRDSLRGMAGRLEEARRQEVETARVRSWSDLARKVAHEIKNPLTPMKMAATALTRPPPEGGEGRVVDPAEAGRVLLEEIDRLDAIARTFSQYGKLPEGPRSEVDVVELLGTLAARHADGAGEIEVEAVGPVFVHGQLDALRRVFENLLANAVEAHPAGSEVSVRVAVSVTDGEVRVEVADRGTGIPEDMLEEIWNPDVTTKRRGTGLGLAIVRQIVQQHGGRVEASARTGGGSVFRVTLPRHRTDEH